MTDDQDTFTLDQIKEATADARQRSRALIPWLPDPHRCDCGAYCLAEREYVEEQADYVDVWVCPNEECGKRYYRGRP